MPARPARLRLWASGDAPPGMIASRGGRHEGDAGVRKLRILFVNRYFFPDHSATSQMLCDLAFWLAGRGWEVGVITSRQRYDDAQALLPETEVVRGVRVHRVWTSRFGRASLAGRAMDYLTFYASAFRALLRQLDQGDFLVAKTDPPLISVVARVAARLRGARLINWIQDLFPEVARALGVRFADGATFRALQWLRDRSLHRADMNVVIGERMAARLRQLGIPDTRLRVIPNWADGDALFPVSVQSNPLRQQWAPGEKFVVMYSGNLGRAHDFDTLLGAVRHVRHRQDLVFLFVGAGHQRKAMEAAFKDAGIDNVRFEPYQPRDRLCHSLNVGDLHLVSLKPELEGLIVPSKFYGVAAVGRSVLFVGDPAGELGALVTRENCGVAVRPGDSQAVADAIVRLADDPALRALQGRNARRLFEREFSLATAMQSWESLLRDITDQSASRDKAQIRGRCNS